MVGLNLGMNENFKKIDAMEDLEKFTQSFYGYGNITSDIWFIGHEEGSKQNLPF